VLKTGEQTEFYAAFRGSLGNDLPKCSITLLDIFFVKTGEQTDFYAAFSEADLTMSRNV
jgi:hypothetical protein